MNPARLSKSYEVRFTVFAKGSPTLMIDRSRTAAKSILIVFLGSILGSLVALRQLRVHLQGTSLRDYLRTGPSRGPTTRSKSSKA